MATNHDLINATDADVTGWGGSAINVTKRSIAANQVLTDAQAIAGVVAASGAGAAVMTASSTNAQRAQVAGAILDSIISDLDLGTPAARKLALLKRGLDEMEQVWDQIGA